MCPQLWYLVLWLSASLSAHHLVFSAANQLFRLNGDDQLLWLFTQTDRSRQKQTGDWNWQKVDRKKANSSERGQVVQRCLYGCTAHIVCSLEWPKTEEEFFFLFLFILVIPSLLTHPLKRQPINGRGWVREKRISASKFRTEIEALAAAASVVATELNDRSALALKGKVCFI